VIIVKMKDMTTVHKEMIYGALALICPAAVLAGLAMTAKVTIKMMAKKI